MKIELTNSSNSNTALHISVKINDKDVGILYLNEKELNEFIKVLKFGVLNSDNVEFENNCYIDKEDDFDDER